jgi:hypothetical protein
VLEKKKSTQKKDPTLEREERVYVLDCMRVTFPTCHLERSPLKARAFQNTAPHSNKEKSKRKMGRKNKEERALFKNGISAATERRKKGATKKRPDRGEGGAKNERTVTHERHFPDLPCGEITIEGTSILKHCTTATTNKSPMIKMGVDKKRGEKIIQK